MPHATDRPTARCASTRRGRPTPDPRPIRLPAPRFVGGRSLAESLRRRRTIREIGDTGLIAGNVHLFAASQGLGCWFHNCDRAALARQLKVRREQRVLFAQSVGYPERGRPSGVRGERA